MWPNPQETGHIYWRNPSWKTSVFVQCYGTKTKTYVTIWARSASYRKRAVLVKFEQVSEAVVRRFPSK